MRLLIEVLVSAIVFVTVLAPMLVLAWIDELISGERI